VLLLTNKAIHVVDTKGFKVKHKLSLDSITELVVTAESDGLLLMRIPLDLKKDKVLTARSVCFIALKNLLL
jgi:myosin I